MNAQIEAVNTIAEGWAHAMWPIIWQSTILAGVVLALTLGIRRLSPAVRFWLWMLVPMRLLVTPLVTVSLPVLPAQHAEAAFAEGAEVPHSAGLAGSTVAAPPASVRPTVRAWFMIAWLGGVVVCVARVLRGCLRVRRLAARAEEVADPTIAALAREAAERLSLTRIPPIRVTSENVSPLLCGALRPVVVLPESLVDRTSSTELSAVLAHEFAHLRRRDLLLGWLLTIAEAFYYFHPVFHLAKRRILFERERACDDAVLANSQSPPGAYARALIASADICSATGARFASAAAVAESFGNLKQRVTQICRDARPTASLSKATVAALAGLALLSLPTIVPTAQRAPAAQDPDVEPAAVAAAGGDAAVGSTAGPARPRPASASRPAMGNAPDAAPGPAKPLDSDKPRPVLKVDEEVHDFGTAWEGEKLVHAFELSNAGNALLVIHKVRPACGCTAFAGPKLPIRLKAGERVRLPFRLATNNLSGPYKKTIKVHSNDLARPVVELCLKGTIKQYVEFQPKKLFVRPKPGGEPTRHTVKILNRTDEPMTLKLAPKQVKDGPAAPRATGVLQYELEEDDPGTSWVLYVTVRPPAQWGRSIAERVRMETNLSKKKDLAYSIQVRVPDLVQVIPKRAMWTLRPGAAPGPKLARIVNNGTEPLELKLAPPKTGRFDVKLTEKVPGKKFLLTIAPLPPFKAGLRYRGSIKLLTNFEDQPTITIPTSMTVRERRPAE